MLRTFFIWVIMLTNSCTLTDSEEIRKPNTSWQSNDQPPVFPGCEDRETISAQWDCFQASISRSVGVYFTDNPFTVNPNAPKQVMLTVVVDQSGRVQLKGIKPDNDYEIREAMQMAIKKLPALSPATKTNLGVTAQVQFRIPIQLQN